MTVRVCLYLSLRVLLLSRTLGLFELSRTLLRSSLMLCFRVVSIFFFFVSPCLLVHLLVWLAVLLCLVDPSHRVPSSSIGRMYALSLSLSPDHRPAETASRVLVLRVSHFGSAYLALGVEVWIIAARQACTPVNTTRSSILLPFLFFFFFLFLLFPSFLFSSSYFFVLIVIFCLYVFFFFFDSCFCSVVQMCRHWSVFWYLAQMRCVRLRSLP
jgi:hypothetical protein